jgi:hypothetical protein
MDELSSRFVGAYNEIDKFPRRLCKVGPELGFMKVVRKAAQQHAGVKAYEMDLEECAHLRNAIAHSYRNYEVIATPHSGAVRQLEAIKTKLLSPPKLCDHFSGPVVIAASEELVVVAAGKMKEGDFSQLPVYSGSTFVHLLTGETIARWLADRFADSRERLATDIVTNALEFTEPSTTYEIVNHEATFFDALHLFEQAHERGDSLDAILMTPLGGKAELPSGIVTIFDLPRLRALA